MRPIMRRHEQRAAPARADFMTTREHHAEAERLTWVTDEVIQSRAKRTLGDLIALAWLHLELAQTAGKAPSPSAEEWACQQCGAAYFGPRPEDGLCPDAHREVP